MKLFPSLNVTSIFLKPKRVKKGHLKGSTLSEAGDSELFWMMVYMLAWNESSSHFSCLTIGFRFSVQLFNSDGFVILLTFIFIPQIPISRHIHHFSTSKSVAFFSAV